LVEDCFFEVDFADVFLAALVSPEPFDEADPFEEAVPFEDTASPSSLPGASDARSVLDAGESTPGRRLRLLSVTYQPEPLKRIGGAFSSRCAGLPQRSHGWCAGAPNDSRFS